ncbi:TPA: hypothetical protein ACP2SZ_005279 [Escherichia coli]
MIATYDSEGNDVGRFDGRFVYDCTGNRIYWIEDGDVFSVPAAHRETAVSVQVAISIGTLNNRTAIDSEGNTIFTLHS